MKFLVISHVEHKKVENRYCGYAPYIREMNLWLKHIDEVTIVAPFQRGDSTAIDIFYEYKKINFKQVPSFNFISLKNCLLSLFKMPVVLLKIFLAMRNTDHIHLRCPGNVGLIGCFVQILFPYKPKTAKYAGNWDPKSRQPWSYRLQKWILNNTFLTRNMQVLVYGEWEGSSKNIKPFFTATYSEQDKIPMKKMEFNEKIHFVFVGTLSSGKNPLYAIQLVEALFRKGYDVTLELYGEGIERKALEDYIVLNGLEEIIIVNGNQNQETVKKAYQKNHFVILPSKSEGWPKAIAEGMFWGCVSIATKVSCVPFMLDYGKRGILLAMNIEKDVNQIVEILNDENSFFAKSKLAIDWSQQYTTDVFEIEIKKLLAK